MGRVTIGQLGSNSRTSGSLHAKLPPISTVDCTDEQTRGEQLWFRSAIVFGAALFILALFVSAVFDPSIRVLHALQALIYVAVVILTRRNSPWGYGAGVVVAAFWNYINLFVTTFIRSGLVQLIGLLQTGRITRPDQFLAIIAATGHCVLIVACLTGFLETRPKAVGSPILATSCPPPGSAQSYAGRHAHERILRPSRIS